MLRARPAGFLCKFQVAIRRDTKNYIDAMITPCAQSRPGLCDLVRIAADYSYEKYAAFFIKKLSLPIVIAIHTRRYINGSPTKD